MPASSTMSTGHAGVYAPGAGTTTLAPHGWQQFARFAFALFATLVSVAIAGLTGWSLDLQPAEKVLWGLFGLLPVLGAHLLPALSGGAAKPVRAGAWVMWAVCMAYAGYSHASFFLLTQEKAGVGRAERLSPVNPAITASRSISDILRDLARQQAQYTKLTAADCQSCLNVRSRLSESQYKIRALNAEAVEAEREIALIADATRVNRDHRQDPVGRRMAAWSGISAEKFSFAVAFAYALILDGVASLCWTLWAQQRARVEKTASPRGRTKSGAGGVTQADPPGLMPLLASLPTTQALPVMPKSPATGSTSEPADEASYTVDQASLIALATRATTTESTVTAPPGAAVTDGLGVSGVTTEVGTTALRGGDRVMTADQSAVQPELDVQKKALDRRVEHSKALRADFNPIRDVRPAKIERRPSDGMLIEQVRSAYESGRVPLTVQAVRAFLKCAQGTASRVCAAVKAEAKAGDIEGSVSCQDRKPATEAG